MAVHGPPKDHESMQYFECNSSIAMPALDSVGFTLSGLTTIGAAGTMNKKDDPNTEKVEKGTSPAMTGTFGVLTALAGVSAIYGYVNSSRCDKAQRLLAARIQAAQLEQAALEENLKRAQDAEQAGCSYDTQCKGDRICIAGHCAPPPAAAEDTQGAASATSPVPSETSVGTPIDVSQNPSTLEATPTATEPAAPAAPRQ